MANNTYPILRTNELTAISAICIYIYAGLAMPCSTYLKPELKTNIVKYRFVLNSRNFERKKIQEVRVGILRPYFFNTHVKCFLFKVSISRPIKKCLFAELRIIFFFIFNAIQLHETFDISQSRW